MNLFGYNFAGWFMKQARQLIVQQRLEQTLMCSKLNVDDLIEYFAAMLFMYFLNFND